jgi:heat shock protein HslJ
MRTETWLLASLLLTATSALLANPVPPLDRSAWQIVTINGKPTKQAPRLEFVRGQVHGSSGCNAFDGTYTRRGQALTFRGITATEMGCSGLLGAQERALFGLLGPNVQVRNSAGGTLVLTGGKHSAVLRRAPNCVHCVVAAPPLPLPKLSGKSWAIQSINGKPVSHPKQAEISFTSKTLSATVGCNRMSGPYEIGKVEYIMTDQMISTLIGCPVGLDEEERVISQLLSDDPRMQYASKPSEPVRLRLSSGRNEAIIVERWFIGLD